jgi:CRP/FNR family transcriptional regulator, dissimilatory nitrate respiration regulator
MNESVLERLARLPHFRMLDRELLSRVAECARLVRHDAGEVLFRDGEPCRAFFAIETGAVKLYRATPEGREQVVHNLGPGHTFAEAALLNFGRFPASAVAMETPTELVEIGGERFLTLFRSENRLAAAMVGSLCMRLVSLVERVEELSLVHAGARLARYLLRQPGKGPLERMHVELAMAKKDLAAHLSMTPETLSRLLRRWQDEGWIESERSSVTILAAKKLQAFADGEETG